MSGIYFETASEKKIRNIKNAISENKEIISRFTRNIFCKGQKIWPYSVIKLGENCLSRSYTSINLTKSLILVTNKNLAYIYLVKIV